MSPLEMQDEYVSLPRKLVVWCGLEFPNRSMFQNLVVATQGSKLDRRVCFHNSLTRLSLYLLPEIAVSEMSCTVPNTVGTQFNTRLIWGGML